MQKSISGSCFLGMVLAGAVIAGLVPAPAAAYCRTRACTECKRDPLTNCATVGEPIAWPNACVSFSMDQAASEQVDLETATSLMQQAFQTWENVRCPPHGLPPSIHVSESFGPAMCSEVAFNPGQGNANIITFRDQSWPYDRAGQTLATTTVKFNQAGVIHDVDMEINSTLPLSTDSSYTKGIVIDDAHDLLSIMTHEAGHFLGLDHSLVPGSIMHISLEPRAVLTTLGRDDEAAICAVYPPDRLTPACDDTPIGGFSPECADGSLRGSTLMGCSIHSAGTGSGRDALFGAIGVTLFWRWRRRRRSA